MKVFRFNCGECPDGIVRVTTTERGQYITARIKKCDKCNKEYGLLGAAKLKAATPFRADK